MATYFQHLEPGDNLGKITKLKYIDDISDDFIFYHFEDGTTCNKDFIAEPGNIEAFNGKFVMAELYSPTAVWTFDQKTISIDEKKTWTNPETGQTFEIAPPGVQKNGQYGGAFGDIKASAKDGQTRISATAPVFHGNTNRREDLSSYMLSVNPNAETAGEIKPVVAPVSTPVENKEEESKTEPGIIVPEHQGYLALRSDVPTTDASYVLTTSDTYVNTINLQDLNNIVIDPDRFDDASNIQVVIDDEVYKFNKDEFKKLFTKEEFVEETPDSIKFIQEYLDKEDVLITNMIEKSKKVSSDIGMDITVTLPPKEVYNTIKNVYSEEMSENFIKSLAYRIPVKCLIDAIASGLGVYYDEDKAKTIHTENE